MFGVDVGSECIGIGRPGTKGGVGNMFRNDTGVENAGQQVVFVPYGSSSTFTDPSYHLPSFYQYWTTQFEPSSSSPQPRAQDNGAFWAQMVNSSRAYFKLGAALSQSQLLADYSTFAGVPTGSGVNNKFAFDAWRVAQNVAMDYAWYAADPWQVVVHFAPLPYYR